VKRIHQEDDYGDSSDEEEFGKNASILRFAGSGARMRTLAEDESPPKGRTQAETKRQRIIDSDDIDE
jgi:hypothetical protein